jgi:hypothetical protein
VLLLVAVSLGALGALAVAGWPGERNGCELHVRPTCFCERLRPGPVHQPANTFSNLGFVLVGLAIALDAGRRRRSPSAPGANPFTTTTLHPTCYAVVTALLGPGSMALHASGTRWGGRVDVISMYLFIALVIVYGMSRWLPLGRGAFVAYAALAAALSATKLWLSVSSDWLFGGLVGAAGANVAILVRARPDLRYDGRFLLAAVALFGAAFAIWLPSLSGGPLCDPDSWLQGHAVWHVLCAGAAGCLYLYLRSERRIPLGVREG